jgi:hypothetical protein
MTYCTCAQGNLVEVKHIMIENIEKVLERGEKLDLLVDKTDNLQVCTRCALFVLCMRMRRKRSLLVVKITWWLKYL